jgi:hypothetical protein
MRHTASGCRMLFLVESLDPMILTLNRVKEVLIEHKGCLSGTISERITG